jgi:hypothetical protein
MVSNSDQLFLECGVSSRQIRYCQGQDSENVIKPEKIIELEHIDASNLVIWKVRMLYGAFTI